MLFKIQNLGAVKEAEIDLSKDLILLCGHNNTGKTYVAYAVYQLLNIISTGDSVNINTNFLKSTDNIAEKLLKNKFKDIFIETKEFQDFLTAFKEDFFDKFNIYRQQQLPIFFASKDNSWHNTKFHVELQKGFENIVKKRIISKDYNYVAFVVGVEGIKTLPILIIKQPNTNKLSFSLNGDIIKNNGFKLPFFDSWESNSLNEQDIILLKKSINHAIYTMISKEIDNLVKNTFIATAERSSINIFNNELNLVKTTFFNNQNQYDKSNINRYSKPIQDSLFIASDLLNISKTTSPFSYLADELEQAILKGKITVGQYGDLRYSPTDIPDLHLEMHVSSSLVKSLASISFYLRHIAQKGDCIIIDEPELNLHPDNQILVARFLARLVNEGFKVIASTHSDYIIREINNLIMLNNDFPEKKDLLGKYKYQENQLLSAEKVGAYIFKDGYGKEVPLSNQGIEIQSIDTVIAGLNQRSDDIYYSYLDSLNNENK